MKPKLKIKIGFFSILLSLTIIISDPYYFLALLFAVSLHEIGHVVGARLAKISLRELKLGIFGAGLHTESSLISYKKEIILSLFGPLANFISIALFTLIAPTALRGNVFCDNFLLSSLSLGVLNLLPIESFDGGRILSAVLSFFTSPTAAAKAISVVTLIIIFSLWTLSVNILIRASSSISLFVFSAYLFSKLFIKDAL